MERLDQPGAHQDKLPVTAQMAWGAIARQAAAHLDTYRGLALLAKAAAEHQAERVEAARAQVARLTRELGVAERELAQLTNGAEGNRGDQLID
jgi:hypothetical protein